MRVVLTITEPIPELVEMLARAGACVTIRADNEDWPVSVTVHLGPDALDLLIRHASRLRPLPPRPSSPALAALLRILEQASPPPRQTGTGPKLLT